MSNARLPKSLFFGIVFAAIVQCAYEFPRLPDRLASHFGASGMPNGWMTKTAFLLLYAMMVLIAAHAVFHIPRQIARKSPDKLKLPNKEYWLAPERRAETFAFFERAFAWYGCAFLLLIVIAMGLVLQANLHAPPQLANGPFLILISAFVLFNVAWVIQFFRRFSTVPREMK